MLHARWESKTQFCISDVFITMEEIKAICMNPSLVINSWSLRLRRPACTTTASQSASRHSASAVLGLQGAHSETALHIAAAAGSMEAMRALLPLGCHSLEDMPEGCGQMATLAQHSMHQHAGICICMYKSACVCMQHLMCLHTCICIKMHSCM